MNARHQAASAGPDASVDASGFTDFADLLEAATGSTYAYCKDSLMLRPRAGSQVLSCSDLAERDVLSGIIDRFAAPYPEVDRRAAVSLWTLYYFSSLTIGIAVLGLELRRVMPASLGDMSLCLDPQTAAPQGFVISGLGVRSGTISLESALYPVLKQHCDPLIGAIAAHCGVGRKLLWTNVAAYLDWIVGEIGQRSHYPDVVETIADYRAEIWPGGWKNPVFGLIRPECADNGDGFNRRKVCCLRYLVPGIGGCGLSCPLPQGRSQQVR